MSLSWGLERISAKYGPALDELKSYYMGGRRIKAACNDCPAKQKNTPSTGTCCYSVLSSCTDWSVVMRDLF